MCVGAGRDVCEERVCVRVRCGEDEGEGAWLHNIVLASPPSPSRSSREFSPCSRTMLSRVDTKAGNTMKRSGTSLMRVYDGLSVSPSQFLYGHIFIYVCTYKYIRMNTYGMYIVYLHHIAGDHCRFDVSDDQILQRLKVRRLGPRHQTRHGEQLEGRRSDEVARGWLDVDLWFFGVPLR